MEQVMEAQWSVLRQQKKALKQMKSEIYGLRHQIAQKDHDAKFCDLAASPLSPFTASPGSRTPDTISHADHSPVPFRTLSFDSDESCSSTATCSNLFQDPPQLPFLCRLPSREQIQSHASFSWIRPPEHWNKRMRKVFCEIRQYTVYRRLWHASAVCNNFASWSQVSSDDFAAFHKEAADLNDCLPYSLPLRCRLTGGLEEFISSTLQTDIAIGTSALTTPPAMAYSPMTTQCVPFGASLIPIEQLLHPETEPHSVFFRPDGVPKRKLVNLLSLLDQKLKHPAAGDRPFTCAVLYCRSHCRVVNEWIGQHEFTNRLHICAIWNSLQIRSMEDLNKPDGSRRKARGSWY